MQPADFEETFDLYEAFRSTQVSAAREHGPYTIDSFIRQGSTYSKLAVRGLVKHMRNCKPLKYNNFII